MADDIQVRRIAEYKRLIENFKNKIADVNPNGLPCPHIPGVGSNYEKSKYKFAFCGIDTLGWEKLSDFMQKPTSELVFMTDNFINELKFIKWMANGHATFWAFILKFLSKFYNIDFSKLKNGEHKDILTSFIWANCNSLEDYNVSSKGADIKNWKIVKKESKCFDSLSLLIKVFHPQVVFILGKKVNKYYITQNLTLNEPYINKLNYEYYYDTNTQTHIFRLPHPFWIGRWGEGLDKYIEYIYKDLIEYNIWEELPKSNNQL